MDCESDLKLHICLNCEKTLFNAFQHCLCKPNHESPSINNIDELADGKIISEPPYFKLIKQPQLKADEHGLARQANSQTPFPPPLSSFPDALRHRQRSKTNDSDDSAIIKSTNLFSGINYKQILAEKNHTIDSLGAFLQEAKLLEKNEHENVQKLQQALAHSVKYAAFAEEWHQKEVTRLQRDIKFLKTQYSSILAFLFQSEQSKKELSMVIKQKESVIIEKENSSKDFDKIAKKLKDELHQSFKNFLDMKSTLERLKKEADTGNFVMMQRNEILHKQLEGITSDYEVTAKELALSKSTIKELETELREVIFQFNSTGDELKRERQNGTVLLEELVDVKEKFKHLNAFQQATSDKARSLQVTLDATLALQKETKERWETDKEAFARESALDKKVISQLKDELFQTSSERLQFKTQYETEFSRRVQLEEQLSIVEERAAKTQQSGKLRIAELEEAVTEMQSKVKKLTETNEQLFKKAAEVKLLLDKEVANTTMLQFEMVQLRKVSEEKRIAMEEQVEKLNLARQSLLIDKKALGEKLKAITDEIEAKESAFAQIKASLEADNASLQEKNTVLHAELSSTQQELEVFKARLEDSNSQLLQLQLLIESSASAKKKLDDIIRAYTDAEREHLAQIEQLKKELDDTIATASQLQREKTEQASIIESQAIKISILESDINALRLECVEDIKVRDAKIGELQTSLDALQLAKDKLEKLFENSGAEITLLRKQIAALKQKLLIESTEREAMFSHVEQLKRQLHEEALAKTEIERTQSLVQLKQLESTKTCNLTGTAQVLKLEMLARAMESETSRLGGLDELTAALKKITTKPFTF